MAGKNESTPSARDLLAHLDDLLAATDRELEETELRQEQDRLRRVQELEQESDRIENALEELQPRRVRAEQLEAQDVLARLAEVDHALRQRRDAIRSELGYDPRERITDSRRVPAKELLPHPKNWRTHPDRQRGALRAVLSEIGYADALVARLLPDGRLQLIDGHLRAETTPDQEVPVLVLDVTEEEAEKLLVSLDPLAAMAGQDEEILRELLAHVKTDSEALQQMLAELVPTLLKEGLTDPDEIPEPPAEATTQPGDLWILGEHRLLCGDSASAKDVDCLLAGAGIQLVHSDPPYNVRVEPRSTPRELTPRAWKLAREADPASA